MISSYSGRAWTGLAVVGMLLVAVLGGVAVADDGGSHTFYSCLTSKGDLKNVTTDVEPTCVKKETLVSWNSEGPVGATGAEGPAGPGLPVPAFESCVGTYYLVLGFNGGAGFVPISSAVWTFSADGTFQATDSEQDGNNGTFGFDPFTHSQGAWASTADNVAASTAIDFTLDETISQPFVTRVNSVSVFSEDCTTVEVTTNIERFDRFSDFSEDPDVSFTNVGHGDLVVAGT